MNFDKDLTLEEIFNLAVQNHKDKKLDSAKDLYNEVLKINPSNKDAHNNLGILFQTLGDNQKAKSYYEKAIELNPAFDLAHNNLGALLDKLGNNQKAIGHFEKAIEINPAFTDAHVNLGNSFKKLKEYRKAINCYEKVIEIDPNHEKSYSSLGTLLHLLGEDQKAIICFEKVIEIDPTYAMTHFNLGTVYIKLKDSQKAISCFEKAIEINPIFVEAYNNLGVMFKVTGKIDKAINCYEKVIEIDPTGKDVHNNLGSIFFELHKYQKAISYYEKAIEINPVFVDAHNNLGMSFKAIGENEKALSCFEKAIEIDPTFTAAYNSFGTFLRETGENEKAISCFEKAIEIDSTFSDAYNNLGLSFAQNSENDKAISCYEKSILHDPNSFSAHANLSNIYTTQLNLQKSLETSYKSIRIDKQLSIFKNDSISLFRLKHDVEQAKYLTQTGGFWKFFNSKSYKINGIDEFQKIGDEILNRKENKNISDPKILLNKDEICALLPFYKENHIYKTKSIYGSCINPNKNWQNIEDEYFNSSNQIMYIDDFLSENALIELRKFCLVSKVWNREYDNKYLGAFSDKGFNSPVHLQIAIDLKEKLPKLFGPHKITKFWGFKYDTTLGSGINIHADFAIHNLNFWITPDKYNNNKNSGGLKIYDAPAPENWTFRDYNSNILKKNIYKFLEDNKANCVNIPYKFNRAVLFNSAYFHETDKIDFKDKYEGRRINNTYLFGSRSVIKSKS
jgi:tetratricopeptide (TPR) repeat protein